MVKSRRDSFQILPMDEPTQKLLKLSEEIRGAFMDRAIWIDTILTDALAAYFCLDEERRRLLQSDVLTGLDTTFSGRIRILKTLLTLRLKEWAADHEDLVPKLDKIRKFRNRLAHSLIDSSEKFLSQGHKDRVQFVFYEEGQQKYQLVTVDEMKKRLAECSEVVMVLVDLRKYVRSKHSPA